MTEAITENTRRYEERAARIRGNRDLNDSAKRRRLEGAHGEAAERHEELIREREEARAREIATAERGVFGLSPPPSAVTERDRDAARRSYRDASFRVLDMDEGRLERVYERAERVGDAPLSQAVHHEAVERGLVRLADRYRETRPDAKKRWDRYVEDRRAADSTGGMLESALTAASGPERPGELGAG